MKNMNTMLHMKLNSAVSVFAVAAAFSVLLPPSVALAGICFLPDCQDEDIMQGDINMNTNSDTEWCEKNGYTYYASGKCPQYQAQVSKCKKDDYYLKCDAVTWCTDNGYNTQSCSLPSFVDGQCPNGKPYYKQCKEDRPRACTEAGYVSTCSQGRLYATSDRCPYDNSYGKCCTASPSTGCPTKYAVDCDPSRGSSGTDTCGYTCYRCCDDNCPGNTAQNYSGGKAGKTECGSQCFYCKDCTSGSTSYSGDRVGSSECGTCYACSDTCRLGELGGANCSAGYDEVYVGSTECGSSCYGCEKHSHSYSCPSGTYSSSSSCDYDFTPVSKKCDCGATSGTCYQCISKPAHTHSYSCPDGFSISCPDGYSDTTPRICSCNETSGTCYKCNQLPACSPGYTRAGCSDNNTHRILVKDAVGCCGWVCPDDWYDCSGGDCNGRCRNPAYSSQGKEGCLPSSLCQKETHTHSYTCPSGYSVSVSCNPTTQDKVPEDKKCSCGATSGTCYKCSDKACAKWSIAECDTIYKTGRGCTRASSSSSCSSSKTYIDCAYNCNYDRVGYCC